MSADWDEIATMIQMAIDQQGAKTFRQLLRDYPDVPGIRMMAGLEYAALQVRVEASKYVGAYGWNAPTGRPYEGRVL